MATRAKATRKSKASGKKQSARKRSRQSPVRKRKPIRKKVAKKTLPKKARAKTGAKPKRAAKPARGAIRPRPTSVQPVSPEDRIGVVTHYYGHLSVATMRLEPGATLHVGDVIHIRGRTTDFTQRIKSLEVDHAAVGKWDPATISE